MKPTAVKIWICALAAALSLVSCSRELPVGGGGEGEPVVILLDVTTRDGESWEGGEEDSRIESMRVLVYESASGRLKWNHIVDIEGTPPYRIEMKTGVYDFVFIANESSDDAAADGLVAKLADETNYNTIAGLGTLTIGRTAFDTEKPVPMAARYTSVTVADGDAVGYTDPFDGTVHPVGGGTWPVRVERVGVCVSMSVRLTDEQYDSWMAAETTHSGQVGITGIPDRVYLLPGTDNSGFRSASAEWFDTSEEPDWETPDGPEEPSTDGHTVFCRVMLPELIFAPNTDESRALVLTMDVGGEKTEKISAPADEDFGYTLPRNTWLHLSDVTVEQPSPEPSPANARITWDAASGRFVLTVDPTDAGLFFKFGSVTGVFSGNGALHNLTTGLIADSFNPADVAWSPVTVAGNGSAGWNTIPLYTEDDYAHSPNTVTPEAGYHTVANVKAGKGDPCRLVGLNLAYIAATPAASLTTADIDNGLWRLPTMEEDMAFTGYNASTLNTDANYWTTYGGVPGGMFPNTTDGDGDTFLPAAGYRNSLGGIVNQGNIYGQYWSSTPSSSANGYGLYFNGTNVSPAYSYGDRFAHAIRCVRQEGQPPVPPEPPAIENSRITWDGANRRYILTTDPTNAGLYFKFGSVTGVFTGLNAVQTLPATNAYPFSNNDVAWSPVSITGTGETGWVSIPSYKAADFAHTPNTVTPEAGYHTVANVKAGKGDPCRLVGLDLDKISNTLERNLTTADIDNGLWRLPTVEENTAFTGHNANGSYTAHWITLSGSGVSGGMFPNTTDGDETTFLPAVGERYALTGVVTNQGKNGHYWSSMPFSNIRAYGLAFSSGIVMPSYNNGNYDVGWPVRCVRQQEPPPTRSSAPTSHSAYR